MTFEHVLEIAAKLDLVDLFYDTVKVAIVQHPDLNKLDSMGAGWNSMLEGRWF